MTTGERVSWGCVGRGSREQPGRSVQDAPLLPSCFPRVLWQVRCLSGSLPKSGLKRGRVLPPGRAAWRKLGSDYPPCLPSLAAGKATRAAGSLGAKEAVWDFLTFSISEASPALLRTSLPVTLGLPATLPLLPSFHPVATWH